LRRIVCLAVLGVLALAAPAYAVNYVTSANGITWGVHDAAAPGLDTGSIRTVTDSGLLGFGSIRVRVSNVRPSDPTRIFNGEMMRGFGLEFDGVDTFTTSDAVTLGGVRIARDVKVGRDENWVRWLDSFTNTTDRFVSVDVSFGGAAGQNNGSGQSRVVGTSSGDAAITTADSWTQVATAATAAGPSANGPSAVVFGGAGPFAGMANHMRSPFDTPLEATGHEANFYGYRHLLQIPPGQTRSLLRYVVVGRAENTGSQPTRPPAGAEIAAVGNTAAALAAAPDLTGLGLGDLCTVANWTLAVDCAGVQVPTVPAQSTPALAKTTSRYDVVGKTVTDLLADMEAGVTSSQEITRAYLDRIAAYDTGQFGFHSFITVAGDAMEQARAADIARAAGSDKPLLGVPVAIKDLYDTKDMPTTNGTLALEGYRPMTDAFQVARMRAAGAVLIGKTNMSEFANSGGQSESGWGQVWNAFKPSKTSLGSSGGSAVATALSFAAFAMGSQTGVSLYAPSTGASLVTFRGTDGLASTTGVMPLTWLQDYAGAMTQTVTDMAIALNVTTGTDPEDPVTVRVDADARRPADWRDHLDPDALEGARIGWVPAAFGSTYGDTGTVDALRARFADFAAAGATMVEMPTPAPGTVSAGTLTGSRQLEGWKRYFDRHPEAPFRSGAEILSHPRVLPYNRDEEEDGPGLTDTDVERILDARDASKVRIDEWMDASDVDAVVYPGFRSDVFDNDGSTLTSDRNSGVPTSNHGIPTVVVPVGANPHGDPMSLQIVGRAWDDANVLGYGYALEQQLGGAGRLLPVTAPRLAYDEDARPVPIEIVPAEAPQSQPPTPEPSTNVAAPPPAAAAARVRPSAVAVRVRGRGRRVTTTGRVHAAAACGGVVAVQIKRGTRTLSVRRAAVRSDCTFRSSVRFKRGSGARRLRVLVRFEGSGALLPRSAPAKAVRLRR
jgi:amidase